MAATLMPIGGFLMLPWIGVCLLLLELAEAKAWNAQHKTQLPELTGLDKLNLSDKDILVSEDGYTYKIFTLKEVEESCHHGVEPLKLVGSCVDNIPTSEPTSEPQEVVTGKIEGLMFRFQQGSIKTDLEFAANVFHSLAEEIDWEGGEIDLEGGDIGLEGGETDLDRDTLPWQKALKVAEAGYQQGLVVPIGQLRYDDHDDEVVVVFPRFRDFTLLSAGNMDMIREDKRKWTAEDLISMAKQISHSVTFLQNHGYAKNIFNLDSVFADTQRKKFLLCFIDNFSVFEAKRQRRFSHVATPVKYELYSIGAMVWDVFVNTSYKETQDNWLCDFYEYLRKLLHQASMPNALVSDDNTDGPGTGWAAAYGLVVKSFDGDVDILFNWLNIARLTAPHILKDGRTFPWNLDHELTEDNASRLHIFCAFALIGDEKHRPTLAEAFRYLDDDNFSSVLTDDVYKRLVPYSQSISQIEWVKKTTGNISNKNWIWEQLDGIARMVSDIPVVQEPEGIKQLRADDVWKNGMKAMDQSLYDEHKKSGWRANVLHRFTVIFPRFVEYLKPYPVTNTLLVYLEALLGKKR
eukprot:GHVS01045197.1.p1 GENE.GHVS01045197.1~~GHVS01045197.1.p1  ORF type:complete len:576 (+),score=59.39 GHVS01045197.1:152-1879(+)